MKMLTTEEASKLLGVSPRTVSIWLKKGILPGFKFGEGTRAEWRLNEETLKEYIRQRANPLQRKFDEGQDNITTDKGTVDRTTGKPVPTEADGVPAIDLDKEPDECNSDSLDTQHHLPDGEDTLQCNEGEPPSKKTTKDKEPLSIGLFYHLNGDKDTTQTIAGKD